MRSYAMERKMNWSLHWQSRKLIKKYGQPFWPRIKFVSTHCLAKAVFSA